MISTIPNTQTSKNGLTWFRATHWQVIPSHCKHYTALIKEKQSTSTVSVYKHFMIFLISPY